MIKFLFALAFFCLTSLNATPAQVFIIRHGEKPSTGESLALKGKIRAAALVPFLLENPLYTKYGPPVAIFAQGTPTIHASPRAIETMTPLAKALNIKINTNYSRVEASHAAQEILSNPDYHGKTVVACFEHVALEDVAAGLGITPRPSWPKNIWDRVWIVNFDEQGHPTLQTEAQELLFGDSTSPNR